MFNRNGVSNVAAAGLEFEYTGTPGSIAMTALSMSRNGTQVFRVPLNDANLFSGTGIYPWSINGDTSAIVYIKNTTNNSRDYTFQASFDGGVYVAGLKSIAARQTIAIDIRDLRDNQVPDINGQTIPLGVMAGKAYWSMRSPTHHSLIGRIEQADLAQGLSSTAACGSCCPDSFSNAWMSPSSVSGFIGDTSQFAPQEQDVDCFGNPRAPYVVTGAFFSSANTSVATVNSSGVATAVGEGSTNIDASFAVYHFTNCSGQAGNEEYCCDETTENFVCTGVCHVVTCTIPTGETTAGRGWLDTIGLFDMTLTPTSTNFANRVVSEQNPGGGSDTCWFSGSQFPPFTSITGGSWTVESGNRYGYDGIGVTADVINYYRSSGRAPCRFTLPQRMVIICPSIAMPYVTNTLVIEIGTTTITTSRAEASQTKTWP